MPASFTQEERLLVGRGIHVPNNSVAIGLHLLGPLDVGALERAVAALVARHEMLRSTFPEDPAGCRIAVTDGRDITLRRLPAFGGVEQALAALAQAAQVPFDLAGGPLFRATLARISDAEHILGLTLDHILVDGLSCQILQRDLLALYDRETGQGPDLSPLDLQFADYATWERAYLRGEPLERLMGHWRNALAGIDAIPASGLTDPDAPAGRTAGLALRKAAIPTDLRDALDRTARAGRVSLFAVLSAALKAVVHGRRRRLRDDDAADVAVLGSLSNRGHRAMKDVVGYFATPTVLRTNLAGDPTLAELATREAQVVFGALCHQEVPHALITRELSPGQYGIRHRFGQADVPRYINFDMAQDWGAALRQPARLRVRTARVPVSEVPRGGLRLIAREKADSLVLEFRYRTDFYGAPWAETFLADYVRLLNLWPTRPSSRLSELGL
ncbi:condensation domain-containing protein [Longispora fulva]|nr:condensation domain-containing protein [Longispora fulva]